MPKSKLRKNRRSGKVRDLRPSKQPDKKPSPRWYGPLIIALMVVGIGIIIGNYMRGEDASPYVLWVGLGLIGAGFVGTTFWR